MIVSRSPRSLSALLLVTAAPAALAQTPAPVATTLPPIIYTLPGTPEPTPEPAASVTPVPSVTPTPTPRTTPTPRATPTVRSTPTARPTPSMQRASATPAPRVSSTPDAPVTSTTPAAGAGAAATPSPPPSPTAPSPIETGVSEGGNDTHFDWSLPLGLILALGVAGGALWWWRRRRDDREDGDIPAPPVTDEPRNDPAPLPEAWSEAPPAAVATPRMLARRAPAPVAAAIPTERAWIELALRPRRAGLNLLTATADVEVVVRNTGAAEARNVRLDARLTSARADQDAELGQVFADTQGRLAVPPFTLAAGDERLVRALVTLPRATINVLTAAGRPMFVPVVTLNARYSVAGGDGQTAQAFALGIERAGAAKLAPFWLDAPSRMFEQVSARPHALAIAS